MNRYILPLLLLILLMGAGPRHIQKRSSDERIRELERRVSQLEKATTPAAMYKAFETEYMKQMSEEYETLYESAVGGTGIGSFTEPLPDTRPTPNKQETNE